MHITNNENDYIFITWNFHSFEIMNRVGFSRIVADEKVECNNQLPNGVSIRYQNAKPGHRLGVVQIQVLSISAHGVET